MQQPKSSINVLPFTNEQPAGYIIDPTHTIFVVGSGISHPPPTCLPLGDALGKYYLQTALGEKTADKLKQVWANSIKWADDYQNADSFGMRLESIIGAINRIDIEFKENLFVKEENNEKFTRTPLIRGFTQFSNLPYNTNHYNLSCIAHSGGIILTPNYDLCIEQVTNSCPLSSALKRYGVDAIQISPKQYVYHFHGIANIGEAEYDLGATVDSVKKSLPSAFAEQFKKRLASGYNIVFMGYSGSDYFDVTPFFEEMSDCEYGGTAIFFDHSTAHEKPAVSEKMETLLRPFRSAAVLYGDTGTYLKCLAEPIIIKSWSDQVIENLHTEPICWNLEFEQIVCKYSANALEIYHFLNALRLSGQTGIHIKRLYPDWERRLKKIIDTWNNDSFNTLKYIVQRKSDLTQSIIGDLSELYKRTPSKKHSALCKRLRVVKESARKTLYHPEECASRISIGELEDRIDTTCYIVNNEKRDVNSRDYESLTVQGVNSRCADNIHRLGNPIRCDKKRTISNLQTLSSYLDSLSALPYSRFLYVSYYISLCKKKNLVDYLLKGIRNPNLEYKMLEIAFEITAINQVIKVYRNLEKRCFFEFIKTQKPQAAIQAWGYNRKADKIEKISGIVI